MIDILTRTETNGDRQGQTEPEETIRDNIGTETNRDRKKQKETNRDNIRQEIVEDGGKQKKRYMYIKRDKKRYIVKE